MSRILSICHPLLSRLSVMLPVMLLHCTVMPAKLKRLKSIVYNIFSCKLFFILLLIILALSGILKSLFPREYSVPQSHGLWNTDSKTVIFTDGTYYVHHWHCVIQLINPGT